MRKEKNLQFYKELMPPKLTLEIHKTEEGLWAKVKELPHCYTQGESFFDLIGMVNDAIYTYLDIPHKFRKKAGIYLPKAIKDIYDEMRRKKWENALRQMKNLSKKRNLVKLVKEETLQEYPC
ncbi:MAG: hypothetical protein ABIJ84_01785 [bacterium]